MSWINNWIEYLTLHLVITIAVLGFQTLLNKKFKRRTDLYEVAWIQLGFPIGLIAAIQALFFSPLGLTLELLSIFVGFGILNASDLWYRLKLNPKGEKHITLNFRETKPDSAPVNVYESHYLQRSEISEILSKNIDTLIRLSEDNEFLFSIMEDYLKLNPADKATLTKYKKLRKEAEAIPKDSPEVEEQAESNQKSLVIDLFKKMFSTVHFHILYFSWMFMLESEELWELNGNIKALIVSPEAKLPDNLNLNCSVLRFEEKVFGKKFTVLFCIHGETNEDYIRKTDQFINYLPIFSNFHNFSESEADKLDLEYYKTAYEDLAERYVKSAKEKMSIEELIQRTMPHEKEKKRKKRLRFKEADE